MRRKIINVALVFMILVIAFSGFMFASIVKGKLYKAETKSSMIVSEVSGNINMQRSGSTYSIHNGAIIEGGDTVETLADATVQIGSDKTGIVLNENTKVLVKSCDANNMVLEVYKGEVFINETGLISGKKYQVLFSGKIITVKDCNTTFVLDMKKGAQTIDVLAGSVEVSNSEDAEDAKYGQSVSIQDMESGNSKMVVAALAIESLDDFVLKQAEKVIDDKNLVFNAEDLKAVLDGRAIEKEESQKELLEAKASGKVITVDDTVSKENTSNSETPASEKASQSKTSDSGNDANKSTNDTKSNSANSGQSNQQGNSEGTKTSDTSASESSNDTKKNSDSTESSSSKKTTDTPATATENASDKSETKEKYTCTLSIRCDTVLVHRGEIKTGEEGKIPSDGCILESTAVEFEDGETVYDVLKRACDALDIQLKVSYQSQYKSYYIDGIYDIDASDFGEKSEWIYKVNGCYTNCASSSFKLQDEDVIVWNYTCEGLGVDITE